MKAFIFDLDGTLLDTLEDIASACNAMLAAHKYPAHSVAAYRRLVGNGFGRLVRGALPPGIGEALAPDRLEALTAEARAFYGAHMCGCTRPYPGVPEALKELARRGFTLAVLSNKPDNFTAGLLPRYFPDIPFALVRGARPGMPLKPDPAGPRAMLTELGLEAGQCFYVGDSDVDILTAHNAGMISVGVAWGFRGLAEVRAAGAHYLVDTPDQLTELAASPLREKAAAQCRRDSAHEILSDGKFSGEI
ncbi:HAD hydrolase-like protein [Desulfovibrio sp. ZJ369]|uniref:HAD family hydrolase n=1 Tax=Desulfovibrio sp. ZJ369 TaxID=2709793 RepID=UPI0013EDEF73|nr:HAD hydrolase-like protein [Desulfovibrio sp. ZJ369]